MTMWLASPTRSAIAPRRRAPTYVRGMQRALRALTILLRAFIGAVLLATGVGKALDVPGFVGVIGTYDLLPALLHWPVAIGMVVTELLLGALLLSGRRLAEAALASTALHAAFTGWASVALLRGLHIENCGCFGVFLARPLTWGTVGEDLFMVAASAALLFSQRRLARGRGSAWIAP